jgi:hypothetical protein
MKADIQSFAETEALEWAVGYFRRCAHILEPGRTELDKFERVKRFLRNVENEDFLNEEALTDKYDSWSGDDEAISGRIKDARAGRGTSHVFLLELAASRLERGKILGKALTGYLVEFLRNPKQPKRRGRKDTRYVDRNGIIANVILGIKNKWGFSFTRNEATESPSAISITKKALKQVGIELTETAITKIFKAFLRRK